MRLRLPWQEPHIPPADRREVDEAVERARRLHAETMRRLDRREKSINQNGFAEDVLRHLEVRPT